MTGKKFLVENFFDLEFFFSANNLTANKIFLVESFLNRFQNSWLKFFANPRESPRISSQTLANHSRISESLPNQFPNPANHSRITANQFPNSCESLANHSRITRESSLANHRESVPKLLRILANHRESVPKPLRITSQTLANPRESPRISSQTLANHLRITANQFQNSCESLQMRIKMLLNHRESLPKPLRITFESLLRISSQTLANHFPVNPRESLANQFPNPCESPRIPKLL